LLWLFLILLWFLLGFMFHLVFLQDLMKFVNGTFRTTWGISFYFC
jgi:hypothetical protein